MEPSERHPDIRAAVRHYRGNHHRRGVNELESFRGDSDLASVIRRAALAVDSFGKRYRHQNRIPAIVRTRSVELLLNRTEEIRRSQNFARLIELIERILDIQGGAGPLYTYDTAVRIGAYLGKMPARVYLHSGTRDGARALGLQNWRDKALDRCDLPSEFSGLEFFEIEDVLCIYKTYFAGETRTLDDCVACWLREDF